MSDLKLKLLDVREEKNLAQKEIAYMLNVTQPTYSKWENCIEPIPLPKLINFCNKFDISLDYICNLSKNKNIKVPKNYIIDKKTIGKNIIKIRQENSINQQELAYLLNTTPSTICSYEKGKTLILTLFAYDLCKKFDVSMDWLCNRK